MFSMFLKTVFKNSFQKQEPNRPIKFDMISFSNFSSNSAIPTDATSDGVECLLTNLNLILSKWMQKQPGYSESSKRLLNVGYNIKRGR